MAPSHYLCCHSALDYPMDELRYLCNVKSLDSLVLMKKTCFSVCDTGSGGDAIESDPIDGMVKS